MQRAVLLSGAAVSLWACQVAESKPLDPPATRVLLAAATPTEVALPPVAAAEPVERACPDGMLLVEGDYCRVVRHRCKRWLETKGRFRHTRCAEYEPSATCVLNVKKSMRFCIDRDEYVAAGDSTPLTNKSMRQAERICRSEGKRLCRESEWNFACEGEELRPYPYGWTRDAQACNADRAPVVGADDRLVKTALPPGSHPRCVSPFGVRDMTGNVEEWTVRDDYPARGAMKGSYWIAAKNHCRAAQRIHGPLYSGSELGFRCCADLAD